MSADTRRLKRQAPCADHSKVSPFPAPTSAPQSSPVLPTLPPTPAPVAPTLPSTPTLPAPQARAGSATAVPAGLPAFDSVLAQIGRPKGPPAWHRWVRSAVGLAAVVALGAGAFYAYGFVSEEMRTAEDPQPGDEVFDAGPLGIPPANVVIGPNGEIWEMPPGAVLDLPPGEDWGIPPGVFAEPEPVPTNEFGEVDFEAEARRAIGSERYDEIKLRTSLTIEYGDTAGFAARATWQGNGDGGSVTAWIKVSHVGYETEFHDLMAHELAHVAVYSMRLGDAPDQECLADIIASEWRGHRTWNGMHGYQTCEWSETAQLVIDEFA